MATALESPVPGNRAREDLSTPMIENILTVALGFLVLALAGALITVDA